MQLRGTTALVTGAAQGLGKAFSEALLSRGAFVCLTDIQLNKGKDVEKELQRKYGKDKALFLQCDVSSEENFSSVFKQAVNKFGQIDLMVNNAGIADESRGRLTVDINLNAVIQGTELAVDHMRKDNGGKGGVVINLASTAGLTPFYLGPIYTATKHGVVGFTSSWASNPYLDSMGLKFACMCPAFTRTAMADPDSITTNLGDKEAFRAILDKVGIGEVEDVVEGFLMLIGSDDCNGDVMTVVKGKGPLYHKKNGKSIRPKL